MKVFEHEGKRYIEYNPVLSIVISAMIVLAVFFVILVIFLIMRSDQIYSDPLIYGAKMYNVSFCFCMLNDTDSFNFDRQRIWKDKEASDLIIKPQP